MSDKADDKVSYHDLSVLAFAPTAQCWNLSTCDVWCEWNIVRFYFFFLSIPKQRHSRNLTACVLDFKNTHFVVFLLKHFVL